MYVWTLNSNMFPEFLNHPQFSLQVKRLESSAPWHYGVFSPWAPWRIEGFLLPGRLCLVSKRFFSVMGVLGHEYNPDQWRLFLDSSKVKLIVVLLHNGNRFPSVPLTHAANMKESLKDWSYRWESLSMTNLSGSYVVISRLWHCYSECNWGTQNIAVSCASGAAGARIITM